MEQQFSSSEESTPSPQQTVANPMVHAKIEAYLTRTCAPLFQSLPREEALGQRKEMQSHLECLIDAYIELGSPESLAVTQALEQFGQEQSVAQAWQQECETMQVEAGRGTLWSALRPIVGYSAINWVVLPIVIEVYAFVMNSYYQAGRAVPGLLTLAALLVFCGEYVLFPGFLGFLAGRRARGKVLYASVIALPLIQLLCLSLTATLSQSLLNPTLAPRSMEILVGGSTLGFYVNFCGCSLLGAGVALWRRKKTLRLAGNR